LKGPRRDEDQDFASQDRDRDQDIKTESQDVSKPRLEFRELHHWNKLCAFNCDSAETLLIFNANVAVNHCVVETLYNYV